MAAAEHQQISVSPAAASTAVATLVTGPAQPAEVIGDFPVARYVRVDTAVIALVTPVAVRLPNALVCSELPPVPASVVTATSHTHRAKGAGDQRDVRPMAADGEPVLVGDGSVQLGRTRVTVGRWWDPVPRLPAVDPPALGRAVESMRSRLPGWPSPDEPAAGQLVAGRDVLAAALAGDETPAAAADRLVGLGPGMTPAGDDLLAGAVGSLVIFGRTLKSRSALDLGERLAAAVESRAAATTVLSADLARHAAIGAVAEPVGTVCHALAGRRRLEPALDQLLAVGHSSGRDLAEGLLFGATAALGTGSWRCG